MEHGNESLKDIQGNLNRTVEVRGRKRIDHLGDRSMLSSKVRREVQKRETNW